MPASTTRYSSHVTRRRFFLPMCCHRYPICALAGGSAVMTTRRSSRCTLRNRLEFVVFLTAFHASGTLHPPQFRSSQFSCMYVSTDQKDNSKRALLGLGLRVSRSLLLEVHVNINSAKTRIEISQQSPRLAHAKLTRRGAALCPCPCRAIRWLLAAQLF